MEHDIHLQALAAVWQTWLIGLTCLATLISLRFLFRYVKDTNTLANTAQAQLNATFAPCLDIAKDLEAARKNETKGTKDDPHFFWKIRNIGTGPAFDIEIEYKIKTPLPTRTSPIEAGGYKTIGTLEGDDPIMASLRAGGIVIQYKAINGDHFVSTLELDSMSYKKLTNVR